MPSADFKPNIEPQNCLERAGQVLQESRGARRALRIAGVALAAIAAIAVIATIAYFAAPVAAAFIAVVLAKAVALPIAAKVAAAVVGGAMIGYPIGHKVSTYAWERRRRIVSNKNGTFWENNRAKLRKNCFCSGVTA